MIAFQQFFIEFLTTNFLFFLAFILLILEIRARKTERITVWKNIKLTIIILINILLGMNIILWIIALILYGL